VLIGPADREVDFLEWAQAIEANYVHPCWREGAPEPHKLLTATTLADMRRQGLGVILWHEERPAELRELAKLDVDGICTGTPDVLAQILREGKGTV
jgi:glycerophosphoryl diester phosphodiesterase